MLNPKQFILYLLLLTANVVNSQYFAPVGAKWYYNADPSMAASYIGYELFEVEKDTIINSLNCNKIIQSRYYSWGLNWRDKPEFVRYENRRVYYYRYGQFRLLYDFNLEVGDTLHFFDPIASSENQDTITDLPIDSVVYVEQDDIIYKTFYFGDDPNSPYRIVGGIAELVGGLYWFLPITKFVIDTRPGVLRCYQDSAVYINLSPGDSTACDYTWTNPIFIGTEELHSDEEKLRVYPNPNNGTFTLNLDKITLKEAERAVIYDLNGRVVWQETVFKTLEINTNLPKGMYFLKLPELGWLSKMVVE